MIRLILLLLILINVSDAQSGILPISIEYSVMLRATYDSNVLRYSSQDIDRALDGTERYQTPNSTLDDLRTDTRITGIYRFKLFGEHSGRIQSSINLATYLNSHLNNAKWVSFTYKQAVHNQFSVLYNHFYEPRYFIRDYFDVHTGERHHADFALAKSVGKIYYRPAKLVEIVGSVELKRYAYNEYFTEYDGDKYSINSECIFRSKPWRISISYRFGKFDNSGFKESNASQSSWIDDDTETGEADYQEDQFGAGVEYSHKFVNKRTRTKLSLAIADRHYQTDRLPEFDPIHHARRDILVNLTLRSSVRLSKKVSFKLGASHIERDSKASDPIVKRVKSYSRSLGWIELSYDF